MTAATRLGTTQRLVLLCMADGQDRTVGRVAMDMALTDSQARNAIARLYTRGLVEPARFDHDGREWALSRAGTDLVCEMFPVTADETVD